jgi:S-formylglutathione hydrolase FrmB
MSRFQFNFALFALSFIVSRHAHAAFEATCGEVNESSSYRYCIVKEPKSQSKDVLYYLHGSGGDEKEWEMMIPALSKHWDAKGIQAPTVISVSFGPIWYLMAQNSSARSGLLNKFVSEVMPKMEKLAVSGDVAARSILGTSMGGFNATQFISSKVAHPEFQKIALFCPGLMEISPWASEAEAKEYSEKYGVHPGLIGHVSQLVKAHVPDEKTWNEEVSPYVKATKLGEPGSPEVFIAANAQDDRFLQGTKVFAELAQKASGAVQFKSWPGEHCTPNEDDPSLADFLAPGLKK